MKKKLILLCFIFLCLFSSFFSFSLKARADNINYYLYTSTDLNVVDEFLSYKANLESYLSINNLGSNYYVFLETSTSSVFKVVVHSNNNYSSFQLSSNAITLHNYNLFTYLNINRTTGVISSSSYNSRYQTLPIYYNNISSASATPRYFIYSNSHIRIVNSSSICTSSDNMTYILDDKSYTQSCSSSDFHILSLYELNELWNSTPPDTMPLLTQFIDLSLGKLGTITDFIFSSYIYLTPFVILIFYFIIYLLRRFV